ncbi:hypothetical protein [Lactococcus formosensis]|uniref:hypothetical protein n=1 Tax=Lactococcus formosensis TaxID=1281486 RepID=UPI0038520F2A
MKRAKICALIGSIFTTLIAVLMMFAFIRFIINWEEKDLEMTLTIAGHSGLFLLKLFALVVVIVMSIMIVNWVSFIRMDRPTGGDMATLSVSYWKFLYSNFNAKFVCDGSGSALRPLFRSGLYISTYG